jgi:hypothetical protein
MTLRYEYHVFCGSHHIELNESNELNGIVTYVSLIYLIICNSCMIRVGCTFLSK